MSKPRKLRRQPSRLEAYDIRDGIQSARFQIGLGLPRREWGYRLCRRAIARTWDRHEARR